MRPTTINTRQIDVDQPISVVNKILCQRFDERISKGVPLLLSIHALTIFVNLAADFELSAALYHLILLVTTLAIFLTTKDMLRFILFSHVYWMFSFMTYFYAGVHGQPASEGLIDPSGSAFIALVSQMACFVVHFATLNLHVVPSESLKVIRWRENIFGAHWLVLALGLSGLFMKLTGTFSDAIASALASLAYLWLSMNMIFALAGKKNIQPFILLVAGLILLRSLTSSLRSDTFALALLGLVYMVMSIPRIVTIRNLVIGFLAWRSIVIFSTVSLIVRKLMQDGDSSLILFMNTLFSGDIALSFIDPFYSPKGMEIYQQTATGAEFGSEFFRGDGNFLARLTMLPQMDIVTSRLPGSAAVRWDEIQNVLLSMLPDFGQTKDLLFSDRVVWDLGLRDYGNVGRPMISAEGEWFAMGGYVSIFIFQILFIFAGFLAYRYFVRIFGYRSIVILLYSQILIYIMFTTTALSVAAVTVRGPIVLLMMLSLATMLHKAVGNRAR